jgi:hypothetical protein
MTITSAGLFTLYPISTTPGGLPMPDEPGTILSVEAETSEMRDPDAPHALRRTINKREKSGANKTRLILNTNH